MDQKYKEDFIKAGKIASQVRKYGAALIVPGASFNDIVQKIRQKIKELGAEPAFPPQLAINEVAAHFIPPPGDDIIFKDQLVSLDIGVSVNGAIGDCAITIDLSGKHSKLIEAAEAALAGAQKILKVGLTLGEIGRVIEQEIARFGFTSVKNLSGHGLGAYQIHTKPTIPNYDNQSSVKLQPGMTFAIEPFATNGKGLIYDAGNPMIFSLVDKKPVRSDASRKVLAKILTFKGLPFAIHDLIDEKLPLFKVKFAIHELLSQGIIIGHAPLIEELKGMVAQAENSVLIDEQGNVIITTL